jgi:hypothetical protein
MLRTRELRRIMTLCGLTACAWTAALLASPQGRDPMDVTGVWRTATAESMPLATPLGRVLPEAWIFDLKASGGKLTGTAGPVGAREGRSGVPFKFAIEGSIDSDKVTLAAKPKRRSVDRDTVDAWKFTGKVSGSVIELTGRTDVGLNTARFSLRRLGSGSAKLLIGQNPPALSGFGHGAISVFQVRDATAPVFEEELVNRTEKTESLNVALEPGKYTLKAAHGICPATCIPAILLSPRYSCEAQFEITAGQTLSAISVVSGDSLSKDRTREGCEVQFSQSPARPVR